MLAATAILERYARRWGIEPLFHHPKRCWGISNLWQQSRTVLETRMQIRSTAWMLAQLLALAVDETFPPREIAPWREGHPLRRVSSRKGCGLNLQDLPFATVLTRSRKNSASQNSAATLDCRLDQLVSRKYAGPSLRGPFVFRSSWRGVASAVSKIELTQQNRISDQPVKPWAFDAAFPPLCHQTRRC